MPRLSRWTWPRRSWRANAWIDEDALFLLRDMDLLDLGALADQMRLRKSPEPIVTFVIDTNPNYTNVCTTDCLFCAFYRKPGAADGYWHSPTSSWPSCGGAVDTGRHDAAAAGRPQPGDPALVLLDLVGAAARANFPGCTSISGRPSEILQMAEVAGKPITAVLADLWERGQRSIPGGGAEILMDRVKKRISPRRPAAAGGSRCTAMRIASA